MSTVKKESQQKEYRKGIVFTSFTDLFPFWAVHMFDYMYNTRVTDKQVILSTLFYLVHMTTAILHSIPNQDYVDTSKKGKTAWWRLYERLH